VVEVRLRIEQHPHVLGTKAELADVGEDLRRRLDEAAVEEDVAPRRGDEERGDLVRPDIMDIADHFEWLDGLIPAAARRIRLGEQGGQERQAGVHAERLSPFLARSIGRAWHG
jgi:hypothetical protein